MTTGTGSDFGTPRFLRSANSVLHKLNDRFPMSAWMLTRKNDAEWIILDITKNDLGLERGQAHDWNSSICHRMIETSGPTVAPDINENHEYANVPIVPHFKIRAYASTLLRRPDGDVWGTLSGINQAPLEPMFTPAPQGLSITGGLLMELYEAELDALRMERRALGIASQGWRDEATGALNHNAWDFDIRGADTLARTVEVPGGMIVVQHDLEPNDEKLFIQLAMSISPDKSRIYRLHSNEFVVLMSNVFEPMQSSILQQMQSLNFTASYGYVPRRHGMTFNQTCDKARQFADCLRKELKAA